MKLSPDERETIILINDASENAIIYTSQKRIMTKLKRNPQARLIKTEMHDSRIIAMEYEIYAKFITIRSKDRAGIRTSENLSEMPISANRM